MIEEGQPQTDVVRTDDNHIYFYAEVDVQRTLDLICQLREVDRQLLTEGFGREADRSPVPIWLHIQSPGGDAFAGFAVADQIASIRSPVYSVVDGYCASAATLVSLACQKRYIAPHALMMIHEVSGSLWGRYGQLKDNMLMFEMLMDKVITFYADRTKMRKKEIKKLLRRESWFDAARCVELGLVDSIKGEK